MRPFPNKSDTTMSGLVRLHDGVPVTDSLTVAREFGRSHKHVLRSLDSLIDDSTINRPNFEPVEYVDAKGERRRMVLLTERGALIAMPFMGGVRSRAGQVRLVDAFLSLRDQIGQRTDVALPNFRDPAMAARAWANEFDQKQQLQITVDRQAVDVAALKQLSGTPGSLCVTDAAKALGVPPTTLMVWLQTNAWAHRRTSSGRLIAYEASISRGILTHAPTTLRDPDGKPRKVVSQMRVTPKGLAELARKVAIGAISRGLRQ